MNQYTPPLVNSHKTLLSIKNVLAATPIAYYPSPELSTPVYFDNLTFLSNPIQEVVSPLIELH